MQKLLERYFYGELNESEKYALFSAIEKDAELKADFIRLQNIRGLMAISPSNTAGREEAEAAMRRFYAGIGQMRRRRILQSFYRYAAAVVIAILCTFFTLRYLEHKNNDRNYNNSYSEITVPVGQRVKITLADGSAVWLNSRSKLRIPNSFDGKYRKVYLDGEAFFNVEKNKDKPFIVETSRYDVHVSGTQFNVLNYSEMTMFETTLLEGQVEITQSGSREKVILSPNEQVVLSNNQLKKSKTNTADRVSWKDGILAFDAEPFSEIIKKLELYYDVKFIIQNTKAMNVAYTGKFKASDPPEKIINVIHLTNKFNYRLSPDNKIIYIR
ncbi:MAG: FecR domain-containing protein [Dysgonamonadaceae bacterium]|jgi:ferric-dicitrate binding protein FerR (iron transport regulator)|nr:FecR domain-containing protein [Dysgonamonadaceae bacterium]